ncbi:polyadenylate-binding protein 2-like protein [Tanacetum coccineum]
MHCRLTPQLNQCKKTTTTTVAHQCRHKPRSSHNQANNRLIELEAARTIEVLNFTSLNGNAIRIMYSHRDPSVCKSGSGNIFIKAIDQKALHDTFSAFGNILSCKIATDQVSQSKGYGFVQYNSEEGAHKTIEKLNGMLLNDKQIYSTTDEEFNKVFSEYRPVTSALVMQDADGNSKGFGFVNFENVEDAAKVVDALNDLWVMRDPNGASKGFGFVAFSTSKEASRDLFEMNGKMVGSKPLYVALAQRKEDRRARLQFSWMRPIAMTPTVAPLTFSRLESEGKLVMGFRKASLASS